MKDLSLPAYDDLRRWIDRARQNGRSWDDIMLLNKKSDEEAQRFLAEQITDNFWASVTYDEWKMLVSLQKNAEETTKRIDFRVGIAQIHDKREENAVTVPQEEYSSWQLYKQKLQRDGFKEETIGEIERTTIRILRRLSDDTREQGPVKGLVIGNVQSGKTANMAALMAMAADWGWNMFIVLSGTIESLRIQTQTRLFSDLNQQGTLSWRVLEHPAKNVTYSDKAQNLHFDLHSRERYFTVCLKNATRLSKLIQWLQADSNTQKQMKIIVIDDEADQAGINTGKIEAEERKRINKLICALVNGENEKAHKISNEYLAMNYIGYTATPYANILNEAGRESIYPRNFITTLAVSKEYFGPQQIFGYASECEETNFEGLDIVRTISQDELAEIRMIHDGSTGKAPESLVDAIVWFLCGVACQRIWGYKKPISMLIHTSQKTAHHERIADVVRNWLEKTDCKKILDRAKRVWERETSSLTAERFREEYPQYGYPDSAINQYPEFNEISREIKYLIENGVSPISLGDDNELTYTSGIHLCIDNCINTGITSDGYHVRLAYPDADKMPSPAPAFIVIGGATLSRGLTIEGLISTYFLRSVGQADTLMQMGRWFGYRKKYELLPRLWITAKTKEQFEFIAALDQELRDEIQYMDINGRSPADYGPKVKNSPKVSFIRITAKNRMQSATESEMDYSGASNQTYLFDNDEDVLEKNIKETNCFLQKLDVYGGRRGTQRYNKDTCIWRGVPFAEIRTFIEKFRFQKRLSVFNDIRPLMEWLEKETINHNLDAWNVIVAGKEDNKNGVWRLPNGELINKVSRTRKVPRVEYDNKILNIGVLRKPTDLLADIELDKIRETEVRKEVEDFINIGETKGVMAIRDKAGLETIPQLLIYRVDKDSKVVKRKHKADAVNGTREDLNAEEDLIGLCLYVPGGRIGTNYAAKVSIKMKNDIFDGDADMEGIDED